MSEARIIRCNCCRAILEDDGEDDGKVLVEDYIHFYLSDNGSRIVGTRFDRVLTGNVDFCNTECFATWSETLTPVRKSV